MPEYNVETLSHEGAPIAMSMLLRAINQREHFITYLSVATELERQLSIPRVFPLHVGDVAGAMMNAILKVDSKAPLINALICRSTGVPGGGAGNYLAKRYNDPTLSKWDKVPMQKKRDLIERERQKILEYRHWDEVAKKAFKKLPPLGDKLTSEHPMDYEPGYGGEAESPEHKRLKQWVYNNPEKVGIPQTPNYKKVEQRLLSGDEVDVFFRCGSTYYVVEVKSKRSNDADLQRGIYQCVKYRAVRCAELAPEKSEVVAILVTERALPPDLQRKARQLNVKTVCRN